MIEEPLIETINAALKQPNGKFDINGFGDLLYNGRPLPRGLVECLEVNGIESTLKHLAEGHQRCADIARKKLAEMQCASDKALKMLDEIRARPDRG